MWKGFLFCVWLRFLSISVSYWPGCDERHRDCPTVSSIILVLIEVLAGWWWTATFSGWFAQSKSPDGFIFRFETRFQKTAFCPYFHGDYSSKSWREVFLMASKVVRNELNLTRLDNGYWLLSALCVNHCVKLLTCII